jgi:hypothetical protein
MADDFKAPHWWQTLPGMLTAIAALLTAVTGMALALHQMGVLGPTHSSSGAVAEPGSGGAGPAGGQAGGGAHAPLTLPAGGKARAGEGIYEVRTARVERIATNSLELRLSMRVTNLGRYPGVFTAVLFRLLVDGVPTAPTDETTSDVVDAGSAKDGLVVFVFPETARSLVLQVGAVGSETNTIPLQLGARR